MKVRQRWYGTLAVVSIALIGCVVQCDRAVAESKQPVATLVATVQTLNGALEVQRTGTAATEPLQERAPLYSGDVTNTGANSKATLLFNEGSRLDVNSGSVVEFTKPVRVSGGRQSLFRLIKGEVFMRARSSLAVQTRSATAAVRGTAFDLTSDAQGNSALTVHEGSVDFFNAYGSVVVHAGEQSIARVGFAPTRPMPGPTGISNISWTLALDQALATGAGVKGNVTSVPPRRPSFWNRGWVKNLLVPALVIGVVGVIIDNNDNDDRRRNDDGGSEQPSEPTG
jgi:hypothetical protein